MRRNKHLLLWTSVGALAVLVRAAFSENVLADWRRAQKHVAASRPPGSAAPEIQLRQIVVPALKATDRCVSCHLGMAPGEEGIPGDRIYGKHPPVVHDPAEYGCTSCHGGQGRATTVADAHGLVPHWPQPMIPRRHAQAGCGSCHTHLEAPSLERLERGRAILERNDCLACHRLDGRGGTLRPGGAGGAEGPDLSRTGACGLRPDWHEHHLKAREAGTPGHPWKSAFGPVTEVDRRELEAYLRTRVEAPALVEAKALFNSLGCLGCHKVNGVGGDDGPDLSRAGERDPGRTSFRGVRGEKSIANWLAEHFRDPSKVVPGSPMPALRLSGKQIDQLVLYTLSLRRADAPEAFWPRDRVRALRLGQRDFETDGATLYGMFCTACHGPRGEGIRYPGRAPSPAVGNPDFLAVASDEFLAAAIGRGRPSRKMPAWDGNLRPGEIREVIAHLRILGGGVKAEPDPRPRRWAAGDAAQGKAIYLQNCAGCHGPEGKGGEGAALSDKAFLSAASDAYLAETIRRGRRGTPMGGFETGSPVRRALSPVEIEALVSFLRTWESSP
jgi:mono/diheme cytochrome c family protein